MEFKQLEYFVCIVEEGSFTRASQKLFLSQPALSKTIKQLEEELGIKLLNRDNKKITLTETGDEVYQKAKACVAQYREFLQFATYIKDAQEGEIVIGIPPGIASCVLAPVLCDFYEAYPNISLYFKQAGACVVDEWVAHDEVDIGVTINPEKESLGGLEHILLTQDTYALIAEPGHPLAKQDTVCAQDLKQLDKSPFIGFDPSFKSYDIITDYLTEHAIFPNVFTKLTNYELMSELASLKKGVTILPRRVAIQTNPANIKIIPITDLHWNVVMIRKMNKLPTSVENKFIQFVKKFQSRPAQKALC